MIANILSKLFPPKLPGRVHDWNDGEPRPYPEQGWAGNVRRKYRDGIDRYTSEQGS